LAFDAAVLSIRGPRPENQDAATADRLLVAVADGVAGHAGGALAANRAVETVAAATAAGIDLPAAVGAANRRLADALAADPRLAGMAATLTAVALDGTDLVVAHLGDSRAYLLRGGVLRQLTRDQTVVQALLDEGLIDAEQGRTHPLRSVVLGALHGKEGDLADLAVDRFAARAGDRLLLCSDGLSGVVGPDDLARVLLAERLPADAATRLVRAALAAGTHDNVTAVVADVAGPAPTGYSGWLPARPPTS
jgi:protein phosphatase